MDNNRRPWESYNISIGFYQPIVDDSGKKLDNQFKRRVQVPLNSDAKPFDKEELFEAIEKRNNDEPQNKTVILK